MGRIIECRKMLRELVTPMLRRVEAPVGVEGEAFAIAQSGREAFGGREGLPGLVGVVAPGAAVGFEFHARLQARRTCLAVVGLTAIGRRTDVDIKIALRIDDEGMHGVIAGQRQPRDDDLRLRFRDDRTVGDRVTKDFVVLLGIDRALVERDTAAASRSLRHPVAEALDDIGLAIVLRVLERQHEAAGRRRVIAKIATAPGVDVKHAVRSEGHMPDVTDIVGEDRRAKTRRERDTRIRAGAGGRLRQCRGGQQRKTPMRRCRGPAPLLW